MTSQPSHLPRAPTPSHTASPLCPLPVLLAFSQLPPSHLHNATPRDYTCTAWPQASDASATAALARRMGDDEGELAAYWGSYLKPDRLRRHVGVLEDMRELMAADG